MKIAATGAARFIAERPSAIGGVLLYGPDYGLKHVYARQLLSGCGEVTELRGETVQHDPALLHDSAYGSSLCAGADGGGAVYLREVGERILPMIEGALGDSDPSRNLIVVEAGELTSKSKLRAFFESHAHHIIICKVGSWLEGSGGPYDVFFY